MPKLEDRYLKEFDSVTRARGEDLALEGRTRRLFTNPTGTRIAVGEDDEVSLDWAEARGALGVFCTCRTFEQGLPCSHVWAAFVELDRDNGSDEIPERALAKLARMKSPPVFAAPAQAVPLKAPALAGWKALLLREPESKKGAGYRQAHFVVDVEGSRRSGLLTIELRIQERLKSGEWGANKSGRFDLFGINEYEDDQDREILSLILSPLNTMRPGVTLPQSSLAIDPLLTPNLLQKLASFERFSVGENPGSWGEGVWDFELDVKDDGRAYRIEGILKRGRERISLVQNRELALLSAGFLVRAESIDAVDWGSNVDLARYLASHSIVVPKKDETDFVLSLAAHTELPSVQLPPALQWPFAEVQPRAVARFVKKEESYLLETHYRYAELRVDPSAQSKILLDPAHRVRMKRDLKAERTFVSGLKGSRSIKKLTAEPHKIDHVPAITELLQSLGWSVEFDHHAVSRFTDLKGTLRSLGDDFELSAVFDFEGESVSLPSFFGACARGERFVKLQNGRVGFVPDSYLDRIDLLLRGATFEKSGEKTGVLRFRRASIPLFKPVFDSMPGLKVDEETSKVFAALGRLLENGMAEAPRELKAQLRSYQGEGLHWLERVSASGFGGILADDMGLGKTMQIISYLLRRATVPRSGPRPSLVVLPKSLVFNWQSEIEKFGPRLRVLDFASANRGMLKAHEYDLVVTTYHVLKNEIDRFEKIEFDTIILDEAQAIKNATSQVAQAVFRLRGHHKFALSGTPIENSLLDLFSLMRFANPGLIPKGVESSAGSGRAGSLSRDAVQRLAVAVSPFILRRTKKQVLTELPDKTEQALVCELEGEQKKLYDQLRKHYRDSLKKELSEKTGNKMQVLEALLRLRQICCHPGLVNEELREKTSAKFEILLEHLEEIRASGNKVLIFSQFTSVLALLKPHLEKHGYRYEYLDGQTRDRGGAVERFNSDPSVTAFLISLKAGGTGLNLTTASYVFLMDPWWNPAIESQAIDRAYRMGQKQKVMAYRLIAQGTIEEKIMKLQAQKRSLAESVISDDPSFLKTLSLEDLAGLFE